VITPRVFNDENGREDILSRKEFHKSILDVLPIGILVLDRYLKVIFLNRASEEIIGLKAGNITGREVREFLPLEVIEKLEMKVPWLLNNWGEIKFLETEIETGDGTLKSIAMNAFPLFDSDGTTNNLVLIIRDVTAAMELAGKYQELFNDIDDIVIFIDREGKIVGRWLGSEDWASPEAFELVEKLLSR